MNIAYIRVSSLEQNEARQVEALQSFGIERWFSEKVSGKDTNRPEFQNMMNFVREGDTVYVLDWSRLSRSLVDLLKTVEKLNSKGVKLVSLKENFDTSTPTGKLMLTVIGALNQFERENMLERQSEGISIAKRNGVYKGRKPTIVKELDSICRQWESGEITGTEAAGLMGVSRATAYKKITQWREEQGLCID